VQRLEVEEFGEHNPILENNKLLHSITLNKVLHLPSIFLMYAIR